MTIGRVGNDDPATFGVDPRFQPDLAAPRTRSRYLISSRSGSGPVSLPRRARYLHYRRAEGSTFGFSLPHCSRRPTRKLNGKLLKPIGAMCSSLVRFSAWP